MNPGCTAPFTRVGLGKSLALFLATVIGVCACGGGEKADKNSGPPPPREVRVSTPVPEEQPCESSVDRGMATVRVSDPRFGAVGDGKNDDTHAIQAAIDSLAGDGGRGGDAQRGIGGIVFFPPGIYRITDAIRIHHDQHHQNLSLVGAGPLASVIVNENRKGRDAISVVGRTGDSIHGLAIRDIGIRGNADSGYGVRAAKAIRQMTFDRVDMSDNGSGGIKLENVSNMITIRDCRLRMQDHEDFRFNQATGVHLEQNAEQVWMYGNSIRGFGTGVRIGSYANIANVYGGDIHGNIVGLEVYGNSRDDGHVSSVEVRGVYFEHNGRDVFVSNAGRRAYAANMVLAANSFSRTSGLNGTYGKGDPLRPPRYAIYLDRAEHSTIEHNEFRKVSGEAVDFLIGLSPNSRRNLVAQNFVASQGRARTTAPLLSDDGENNWGQTDGSNPLAWRFPGAVSMNGDLKIGEGSDAVLQLGEHSLWFDRRGRLRVMVGRPTNLNRDGRVLGED